MTATARRPTIPAIEIDVSAGSDLWSTVADAESTIRRAIEAAAAATTKKTGTVAVMLTDDDTIRAMNAQWRGIDKPTNVLSFPAPESPAPEAAHLGDIAIAFETVAAESATENKAFPDHLAHLAIHGYLHLVGFEHETDTEAARMESLETHILSGLGIADPYAVPTSAD